MGFFSWVTSDTNESISNTYSTRGALPVYLLIPEEFGGGSIYEESYEGYGDFGGEDAYALLARWNKPEECNGDDEHDRMIGIRLEYHENEKIKYPLKFTENEYPYWFVNESEHCEYQGFFYPEDDEDEYDDWKQDDRDCDEDSWDDDEDFVE